MKRTVAVILLTLTLAYSIISLTGCNNSQKNPSNVSNNTTASTIDKDIDTTDTANITTDSNTKCDTSTSAVLPDHVILPAEGEIILSLYTPGDITGWLDNNNGNNLSIEKRNGIDALTHVMAPTSISFKKKFNIDWLKYKREDIYIVVDIYIDETPDGEYKGSLKIKNGDKSDDSGNTSENNQLNFDIRELDLKGGWNSYILPLSDAIAEKGDDYTIADWFCLWINNLGIPYEVAIGRLDIVNNPIIQE